MVDKVLAEEGQENLVLIKPTDVFGYLSGYFSVDKDGKRYEYFKLFKKQTLEFFEDKILNVKGVDIYEGQLINKDTKWVEIP